MKFKLLLAVLTIAVQTLAQVEPGAGKWKTWFIGSAQSHRLKPPPKDANEINRIIDIQKSLGDEEKKQIHYWNAGAPGYRWHEMMSKLWTVDTGRYGALANLLLGTAIYDATIVAWDTKYAYNRTRPFLADKRIKAFVAKPESPSYPCEHSVAAGVAVTVFSKYYPHLADSMKKMAKRMMDSRVAAGVVYPSDVDAGFELGKNIAEKQIELTKDFVVKEAWDGKIPEMAKHWRGKFVLLPLAGNNKTVVLNSSSEFRPGPPPDFAKEMEEIRNYKQNFRSLSNAFYWANQSWFSDQLVKKMFEYNLNMNPPRAARIAAAVSVASYDGFVACWDAKYAYWGIRPNQYDTTFRPAILITPPFPGYPSGHAAVSATMAEVLSYFFPEDSALHARKAKEAAESRFQAGIHFRSDNEVALELGKKVGQKVIERVKKDGAEK